MKSSIRALGVVFLALIGVFLAQPSHVQAATTVDVTVDQSTVLADSHSVQAVRVTIHTPNPNSIYDARIQITADVPTTTGRGYFRFTTNQGFYEYGDIFSSGNMFVTLLPRDAQNSSAGSQYIVDTSDPTDPKVTFVFRFTLDPTSGTAQNSIRYSYESGPPTYTSGWQESVAEFNTDAQGYVPVYRSHPFLDLYHSSVTADGNDIQTARIHFFTQHPETITDVQVYVNLPGGANSNQPQGWFEWDPRLGFQERSPGLYGNNNVELLNQGPNASTRTITQQGVVYFEFKWKIAAAVGNTSNNVVYFRWREGQQYNSNWSNLDYSRHVVSFYTNASIPATVQVMLDPSTATSRNFSAGIMGANLATFNFYTPSASTEDTAITKIYFTQNVTNTLFASYHDYDLLYITDDSGTILGSVVPTSSKPVIELNPRSFLVPRNSIDDKKMYLKANIASISPLGPVTDSGDLLGYSIATPADVSAKGELTSNTLAVTFGTSAPIGNTHYMFKAVPRVFVLPPSTTRLANGTNELVRFSVAAYGGDIDLHKFTFEITQNQSTVNSVQLVDITDATEIELYSGTPVMNNNTALINANITNNSVITDGAVRTYILRGMVTGIQNGAFVRTRLAGDTKSLATVSGRPNETQVLADADVNSNFIWSDRSAGLHSSLTSDWMNGYLVLGLNAPWSTQSLLVY